jgi:mRNA interferase RelE/StbE
VYRVELTKSAAKLIEKLPTDVRKRVITKMEMLADNPRPPGAEKLAGEENAYRVRTGDYRIVYEIHDRVLVVLVVNVGHRREVYR